MEKAIRDDGNCSSGGASHQNVLGAAHEEAGMEERVKKAAGKRTHYPKSGRAPKAGERESA